MATLLMKEVGGTDTNVITGTAPNDTSYGQNWAIFGAMGEYTRTGGLIQTNGSNCAGLLGGIGGYSDLEIRATGIDMNDVPSTGDQISLAFLDVNTGSPKGYEVFFDPRRGATSNKAGLDRLDPTTTSLADTVESTWSWTAGDTVDMYLRFNGSTVTGRIVQSSQSLDETFTVGDTTYPFGVSTDQLQYLRFRSTHNTITIASFELWNMAAAGGPSKIIGTGSKLIGTPTKLIGI